MKNNSTDKKFRMAQRVVFKVIGTFPANENKIKFIKT